MKKFTREEIINLVKQFIEKNGHEPSSFDFCELNNLPNRKTVERIFGGLVNMRKEIGLYNDHRTGEKRKDVANFINNRAIELNTKIYKKLLTYFSERDIHRESSIFDDRRNRTDFKVYGKDKVFLVDIFYPKDISSLNGCILAKSKKYPADFRHYLDKNFDKIIFLNLNGGLFLNNIPLKEGFCIMNESDFWNYCKTMV